MFRIHWGFRRDLSLTSRVLVVEDHELWRRHLRAMLGPPARWEVVGEASDGLEAIQKAADLNPDLILLDIGLPGLDGIQTARRLLTDDPRSRILFVSEHQSWTSSRLRSVPVCGVTSSSRMPHATCCPRWTPSSTAGGSSARGSVAVSSTPADDWRRPGDAAPRGRALCRRTLALDSYIRFAEAALTAGTSLIILLPGSRRDALHQRLLARGNDVDGAMRGGHTFRWRFPPSCRGSWSTAGSMRNGSGTPQTRLISEAARATARNESARRHVRRMRPDPDETGHDGCGRFARAAV